MQKFTLDIPGGLVLASRSGQTAIAYSPRDWHAVILGLEESNGARMGFNRFLALIRATLADSFDPEEIEAWASRVRESLVIEAAER